MSIRSCADIGDPSLQARIQQYFDSRKTYPAADSPDEYASYFETAYPDEGDRRKVLEIHITAARPSYGHLAIASLLKAGRVRVLWTTNFDRTIEDAAAQVFGGTATLRIATLDSAAIALNALNEGRWPMLGKLHGDFQSGRLKNTSEELRKQDVLLREALVQGCQRSGLAVVGYSGRDESIVDALSGAMDGSASFPAGLFWFHRTDQALLPGVRRLAQKAQEKGVAMHLLAMETFDELMADIVNIMPDLSAELTTALDKRLGVSGMRPFRRPARTGRSSGSTRFRSSRHRLSVVAWCARSVARVKCVMPSQPRARRSSLHGETSASSPSGGTRIFGRRSKGSPLRISTFTRSTSGTCVTSRASSGFCTTRWHRRSPALIP